MQYILTEEEYKNLVSRKKLEDYKNKVEILNMKVLELTRNGKCIKNMGGYCDDCPISNLGTGTCDDIKDYSK